ncbi:hypothetical protein O988_02301 [Pseudogymnoascus sp. VKM F-3808]|nr:hypothetical protein O988_02301 [Pseudogymnoascus sp. VKM F-3808]
MCSTRNKTLDELTKGYSLAELPLDKRIEDTELKFGLFKETGNDQGIVKRVGLGKDDLHDIFTPPEPYLTLRTDPNSPIAKQGNSGRTPNSETCLLARRARRYSEQIVDALAPRHWLGSALRRSWVTLKYILFLDVDFFRELGGCVALCGQNRERCDRSYI